MEIDFALMIAHLIVGSILVFIATKAFKKTKYPPMALLATGFALIVVGDTIMGDLLSVFHNDSITEIVEESIEIVGFITLILAVKRS